MANKLDMILNLTTARENITHLRKGTCQKTDMYVEYDMLYNYVDRLLADLLKEVANMPGDKIEDGPMLISPGKDGVGPNVGFKSPAQLDHERLAMVYEYLYKTDSTFKLYADSK